MGKFQTFCSRIRVIPCSAVRRRYRPCRPGGVYRLGDSLGESSFSVSCAAAAVPQTGSVFGGGQSAAYQKAYRERIFTEHGLSERERKAAALMLEGLDNDAIGDKLCVSKAAARYHIGNIYGKFGIDGKRGGHAALLVKIMQPEDQGRGDCQFQTL
jgi:DNA-binding CsgD family transcriptional regulator